MKVRAAAVCLMIVMAGCTKPNVSVPKTDVSGQKIPPSDPVKALYEKVRSGHYQLSAAIDSIEEVHKTTKGIAAKEEGDTKRALLTVVSELEDAGKTLTDFSDDPPSLEDFKKDFAAQDEDRLKAIDSANEALDDLEDCQDLVSDLLNSHPPEPEKTMLMQADESLNGCVQSVSDAIKALGGKVATAP